MIYLRPGTLADGDRLFSWRNDPVTCANSRSTAAVPREDHDRWMKFNVLMGQPEHAVIIAEGLDGCVGVVRFDAAKNDLMAYEASITIAPEYRGRGLARSILTDACVFFSEFAITAEVRHDNVASRKLFERCGFEENGRSSGFLQYRKEPVT
jgi:RimJ/RimL family protein N-acetyltransferase